MCGVKMKLALLVYLAGLSENIACALLLSSLFVGIACFILTIDNDKLHKKSMYLFFIFILIAAILPSKSTIYTMIVVNNDKVQSIGSNALDIIDMKLKEIKELEDSKK